jgi:hypothetical protein
MFVRPGTTFSKGPAQLWFLRPSRLRCGGCSASNGHVGVTFHRVMQFHLSRAVPWASLRACHLLGYWEADAKARTYKSN